MGKCTYFACIHVLFCVVEGLPFVKKEKNLIYI